MSINNKFIWFATRLIEIIVVLSIVGCGVGVPTRAEIKVMRTQDMQIDDDDIVTMAPRRILEAITREIEKTYKNIELVDGFLFRDTAFSEGGWRLKKLLMPEIGGKVSEQLGVDYLVVVGAIEASQGEAKGFMIPPVLTIASGEGISTITALIIDLKSGLLVSRIVCEARGTTHIFHYVILVAGNEPQTESGAMEGLAREIGRVITESNQSGTARLAILGLEDFEVSYDPDDWESDEPDFKNELALEILQERAAQGDQDAQWVLYQVEPNAQNIAWLCLHADQGKTRARSELANLYFYGSDKYHKMMSVHVPADISRACVWFHLAGQAEITRQAETNGAGQIPVPYDSPEVERTSSVMTADELAEAEQLIQAWKPGQCDRDFSGHMFTEYAKDPALARICTAADQGDFAARDELGRIYFLGSRGVKEDLPRAYMWYRLAAKVHVPPDTKGGYMQTICDAMTPKQRDNALQLLEAWKPGECERDLLQK